MKSKNKYDKPDSAEFLRYLKGEMTESERNSFEKELQKNPFAQEAMEGIETLPARDVNHDLVFLQQKISRRRKRKNRFTYYRIAASIAVLMIISSVFYVVERTKIPEQLSIPRYSEAPLDIQQAEPVRKAEADQEEESQTAQPEAPKQKKAMPPEPKLDESKDMAGVAINEAERIEPQREVQLPAKRDAVSQMPVMAEESEAVQPAAAVRSQVRYNAGVTAGKGADGPVQIEITVAGEEIADEDSTRIYSPPQPVNGKDEYQRYINEHYNRPDPLTEGQRVVVVAAFKILPDGSPDSIRIVRSPDEKFSSEAIRLIKSGPAWKPATRNGVPADEKVSLRFVFR